MCSNERESEITMKVICPECRKEVEYFTLTTDKTLQKSTKKFGELTIKWYEEMAHCKDCKTVLYVSNIEKENNQRFQNAVKEAQRKNVGFDYTDLQKIN